MQSQHQALNSLKEIVYLTSTKGVGGKGSGEGEGGERRQLSTLAQEVIATFTERVVNDGGKEVISNQAWEGKGEVDNDRIERERETKGKKGRGIDYLEIFLRYVVSVGK
jgi:hypothetical protein